MFALLANSNVMYPSGMYTSVFRIPHLLTQHVSIQTNEPGHGLIKLNGFIEMEDEFCFWPINNNNWDCQFNSKIQNVLKKYRCSMRAFMYDADKDEATVMIDMPLKTLNIKLKKYGCQRDLAR